MQKDAYIEQCWKDGEQYAKDIREGKILSCKNIKLAIERYYADLQRDDLDFRKDKVNRVFNFFYYLNVQNDMRFKVEPFQAFIVMNVFGFYYKGTPERRYQYFFLFMGRKNGKTTFATALTLYSMLADEKAYPRTLLISSSQRNARDTSYATLQEMIKASPVIDKRLIARKSNRVEFKDSEQLGYIQTTVMDMDKIEGYIIECAIIDEIHTYKNAQRFNVVKNSLGTRLNPLLFLISTGGYGQDTFCTQLVETGRKVVSNEATDDRFFFMLYELDVGDDWKDEKNWIKANPGLGTILDMNTFRDNYNTSKNMPSLLDDFLTKRLNMFLEENTQWVDRQYLDKVFIKDINEERLRGMPAYVGLDLSKTRDLTSIVVLFDGGERFYVKPYFFFVEHEQNALRKGNIDINKWIKKDYIIRCNTPTIDMELIKRYLKEIYDKYDVQGLYYDPWHFEMLREAAIDIGYWCVPIRPGVQNMDPAIRFIEEQIYRNNVDIYKNDCMRWNFRNVVIKNDQNGNMKADKNASADAIDGVISLLNATAGYLRNTNNPIAQYMKYNEEKIR